MRPASSTTSGTRAPANPCWRINRSATSAPPLSTECDASTRRISMSLSNFSAPSPTVKIGTDLARSESSSSPIGARELSAPSLSTTRPGQRNRRRAPGAPARSPRRDRVSPALNVRSAALSMRCALDEKRNRRTMNFCLKRLEQRAVRRRRTRARPSRSAASRRDRRSACCASRRRARRRSCAAEPPRTAAASGGRGTSRAPRAPRRESRRAPSGRAACSCPGRRRSSGLPAPRSRRRPAAGSRPKRARRRRRCPSRTQSACT